MVKLEIRKNAYYDSVTLMLISKDIKKVNGIGEALVGMGTDLNREIAANIGLETPEFDSVTPNDFFVAVQCDDEMAFEAAKKKVDELLNKKSESKEADYYPPTLEGAIKIDPDINLAVISVPGKHAAAVAQGCLERDINVMLFSDNVTIEEERALKEYAYKKELLVMGPDCGTAIINHVPLAFANVVRAGDIGIVAASGTGTQEVSSIIDQLGGGISQVIGTGGRDLKKEIGGLMMKLGLDALVKDPRTNVITLISKPPAKEIATEILSLASKAGKSVVVCFIGGDREEIEAFGLTAAISLEDAAHKAVALSKGESVKDFAAFSMGEEEAEALAKEHASKMAKSQKYVRGFYTGGTLCDEAMKLMLPKLGHIYSNIPLQPEDKLNDARNGKSYEHTFLDFGDDEFTVGRPHPMIDPSLRAERVITDGKDPECAIIMVDCVIGYGSHENPAGDLAEAIRAAKEDAVTESRHLLVVAAVCGTEGDPQCLSKTQKQLTDAGAVVLPSNAQATRFAELVLAKME
ncbi:acyl-CoA synthetase FdrA [Anaerocolumna sp.]|uniref:acyl-CoA synthetase FdrA n=1 Tax=Anaerocolumna sp. TaxID=2041569 RepID=UPI0028AA49D6|nr:acyl-CoA synthetase FdrA [Anaerocolumna sp.]